MARRRLISLSRTRVAACQSPRWCLNTEACALEPPYCSANHLLQRVPSGLRDSQYPCECMINCVSGISLFISDAMIGPQPMQTAAKLLNVDGSAVLPFESQLQSHATPVCGRMWWHRLRTPEFISQAPSKILAELGAHLACKCVAHALVHGHEMGRCRGSRIQIWLRCQAQAHELAP